MLKMAVGHSDEVSADDAIAAAIDEARASLGSVQPDIGMLFSTVETFDPAMVATVRNAFPGITVVGATSSAEISSNHGYQEDSVTLALLGSDSLEITAGLGRDLTNDVAAAARAAVSEALAGTTKEPRLCLMLSERITVDPQITLEAVAAALPPDVVVLGGLAARNDFSQMTPTYQFRSPDPSMGSWRARPISRPPAIPIRTLRRNIEDNGCGSDCRVSGRSKAS